jgi:hypothetical protein
MLIDAIKEETARELQELLAITDSQPSETWSCPCNVPCGQLRSPVLFTATNQAKLPRTEN